MKVLKKPKKMSKVKIDSEMARGVYSNLPFISYTNDELFFDFLFKSPDGQLIMVSRVIMTIDHLAPFAGLLQTLVAKISMDRQTELLFGSNRKPPAPSTVN